MGENTIEKAEIFFHNGTKYSESEKIEFTLGNAYSLFGGGENEKYIWRDGGWRSYAERARARLSELPLNIYELELSFWKPRGVSDAELASELATYVKQMGYTHICLKGAVTSDETGREYKTSLGESDGLRAFVDRMHESGTGVILGWNMGELDVKRTDKSDLFILGAIYLADTFHADGLKVSVRSVSGDSGKIAAFFGRLNRAVREACPSVLTIADGDLASDGMGFDLVCDTARMRGLFEYAAEDPLFRKHHHEKIVFSSERVSEGEKILPISDIAGRTLADAVSGDLWQRLATLRALLAYQMTVPAKKLISMGTEIARGGEIDWNLLERDEYARLQLYVSELNSIYLESPQLWSYDGFEWIDAEDRERSIISYRRRAESGEELIAVINFTPVAREGYTLGVPSGGEYEEIFNSDSLRFGGSGVVNAGAIAASDTPMRGLAYSLRFRLPPLGALVLRKKQNTP